MTSDSRFFGLGIVSGKRNGEETRLILARTAAQKQIFMVVRLTEERSSDDPDDDAVVISDVKYLVRRTWTRNTVSLKYLARSSSYGSIGTWGRSSGRGAVSSTWRT
jgi:hypothetical protein